MHDENKRAATLPMQVTLWRPQETGSFEQISSWIAKRPTDSSNEMDEWEGFHLLASTRSYVIAECMYGGKFEPHAMLSLQEQTPAWSVNHDMTWSWACLIYTHTLLSTLDVSHTKINQNPKHGCAQ